MKRKLGINTHIGQKDLKKKDKEAHYIIIIESIQEENITIINIYVPKIVAPEHIKQFINGHKKKTP